MPFQISVKLLIALVMWMAACLPQIGRPLAYTSAMKQNTTARGVQVVAVGQRSISKAMANVVACQGCTSSVSRSFGAILVEVVGAAKPSIEYIMSEPAHCPECSRPIFENTLVCCEGDRDHQTETIREFEPNWEETNVVLVDEARIAQAESCMSGCEHCVANTETTFDYILDMVTKCDPAVTEYVLCSPAKCPRCGHEVTEKTFISA